MICYVAICSFIGCFCALGSSADSRRSQEDRVSTTLSLTTPHQKSEVSQNTENRNVSPPSQKTHQASAKEIDWSWFIGVSADLVPSMALSTWMEWAVKSSSGSQGS